jgi:hypothetical protein
MEPRAAGTMAVRRALAAAMLVTIPALALAACGGTVTGTGSNPDCNQSPDATSCNACYQKQYPGGIAAYNDVATCIFCSACYTTCESATSATFCAGAPACPDPCDMGTPGTPACDTCQTCASAGSGSCASVVQTCLSNPDCKALLGATCG